MRIGEMVRYLKEQMGADISGMKFFKGKGSEIRCCSPESYKKCSKMGISGILGIACHTKKKGFSSYFFSLLGNRIRKRVVDVNQEEAKKFCERKRIRKKIRLRRGPVAVRYAGHILGTATYEAGWIHPKISEKRARRIINDLWKRS